MGRWFNDLQGLVWAATLVAVAMAWAYQSFATIAYVDQKHQSAMEVLRDIQFRVEKIDERTYDLAQRRH